jgi:heat shock protein HslJ
MKKASLFAVLITTALLFQSCGSTKNLDMMSLLSGKSFNVESIMGKALNPADFMKGLPTFNFGNDGKMTGSSGCNNFMGNFKVDGKALSLDPGAMTRMACPGNGEGDFLNAVKQVNGLKAAGNKIKLLNGATEVMSLIPKL